MLFRWYLGPGHVSQQCITRLTTSVAGDRGAVHRGCDVFRADIFKLLGNSVYSKLIEALEWQTDVIYTKDKKVVDGALQSAFFKNLDEIGQAYELTSCKKQIIIKRNHFRSA